LQKQDSFNRVKNKMKKKKSAKNRSVPGKNKIIIFPIVLVFSVVFSLGIFHYSKAEEMSTDLDDFKSTFETDKTPIDSKKTTTDTDKALTSDKADVSATNKALTTDKAATETAKASASSGSTTSINFSNPINATSLTQVLNNLLTNLKSVVIIVAIIFIVIGGLMYMMSGGNEKTITRAKSCVAGAIIGLAIVLAAPIFLREILTIFGGSFTSSGLNTSGLTGSLMLKDVATKILNLLLSVLGIIAIISLVIGGGMYLTAYGDEKKIETAKKIVTYAIIGITISLASIVIVREVGNLLGESVSGGSSTTTPATINNTSVPAKGYTAI